MNDDALDRCLFEAFKEPPQTGGVVPKVRDLRERMRVRQRKQFVAGSTVVMVAGLLLMLCLPISKRQMAMEGATYSMDGTGEFKSLMVRIGDLESQVKHIPLPVSESEAAERDALARRVLHLGAVLAEGTGDGEYAAIAKRGVIQLLPETTWAAVAQRGMRED